eukprot:g13962.t1
MFTAYGDSYEDLLEKLLSEQGRGRWSVEQCEAMEFRLENEERMQHQKARFLLECLFFAPHVTSSVPGAGAGGVIRHRPSVAVAIAFYCAKNKQQVDAILDIALQHRPIGSHVPAILKDIEEFLRGELYLKKVFKFVANSGKRVVAGDAAQEPRAPSPFDAVGCTRGQIEPGQKSQASQQSSNGSPSAACSSGDGVVSDLVYPEYRNFSASMFRDTLCFAEKWRELLETRRQVLGMSPQTSPVKVVKKAEIDFSEGRQQQKMVRTPESEKKQSPPPKRKPPPRKQLPR